MKKRVLAGYFISSILSPVAVLAQGNIGITPPSFGYNTIGGFVTNVLTLAFVVALLVVLFMLIWGAFEWITSGGDKEAVGKARSRIINALIGLAVLAVAFALIRVAGTFLGIPNLQQIPIPVPIPGQPSAGEL